MAHDETAAHLAGGLPDRFPSSPRDDNYRLMQAVADRFDIEELNLEEIDTLTTVQEINDENVRFETARLTVEAGESYHIADGEVENFYQVVVDGELTVSGVLRTTEVTGGGEVTVLNGGEIIGTSSGDHGALDALHELGKLVQVTPQDGESVARYRSRVMAEYALVTCKGTIEDLLETAASILDVNISSLEYSEPAGGERGTVMLSMPGSALDDLDLSTGDAAGILDRLLAAGYRIEVAVSGTFTYMTPTEYEDGLHDSTLGYDGLDGSGEPKDNGGTYAGVIS